MLAVLRCASWSQSGEAGSLLVITHSVVQTASIGKLKMSDPQIWEPNRRRVQW